jgi:CMP-N,N'-diacetyllegionaminic acid synthase
MINNKKILAVVTARAGSKGIPGKNFRPLLGKPLFMWSMQAALDSKYVDTIVLSSNCEECEKIHINWVEELEVEQQNRIIFWQRPEAYSTDTSKNEDALIHALISTDQCYGLKHDVVINLQPTSPCRLNGLLDKCIEKYEEGNYDSLLTGSEITPFLWQKKDGKWEYMMDNVWRWKSVPTPWLDNKIQDRWVLDSNSDCCKRKMRQEFGDEILLHDNGSIYLTDSKILLDKECRIGYNPYVFKTEGINNIQIDKEDDFLLIEKMIETKGLESLI